MSALHLERSLKVKALAAEIAAERNVKVFLFFLITLEPRVEWCKGL
jgi:hypothetical protein